MKIRNGRNMAYFIPVQIPALFLNSQEFTRALKVM